MGTTGICLLAEHLIKFVEFHVFEAPTLCQIWLKSVTKPVEGEGWEETKTQETGIMCHCTGVILLGNWRTVAKKQFFLREFKSNCSNCPWAGLEKLNVWSLPYHCTQLTCVGVTLG